MPDEPALAAASTLKLETCPLCREWLDPTDTTLQYAVELHPPGRWDTELVEGPGAFFHSSCYRWARGYRRKPHPWHWTPAADG